MPRNKRPGKRPKARPAAKAPPHLWAIVTYVSESPQGAGFFLDSFVSGNKDVAQLEAQAAHASRPGGQAYSQSFAASLESGQSCIRAHRARPADVWLLRRNVDSVMEYRAHARATSQGGAPPECSAEWDVIKIADAWVSPEQLALKARVVPKARK